MRREIPRYLFRYWAKSSGGNAKLNSTAAITPLAFLKTPDLPSFYQTPQSTLRHITDGHLEAAPVTTLFSSWSQSLPFVMSMASGARGLHGPHISILDTRDLPEQNVILHTSHMNKLFGTDVFNYEFLAFGTIKGDYHKAVPFREFLAYLALRRTPDVRSMKDYPAKTVTEAIRVATTYGTAFAVIVAAHLLASSLEKADMRHAMERLAEMAWPDSCCAKNGSVASVTDPSLSSYFGLVEAWKAALMLQDLALRRYCHSDSLFLGDSVGVKQKLKTILASSKKKGGAAGKAAVVITDTKTAAAAAAAADLAVSNKETNPPAKTSSPPSKSKSKPKPKPKPKPTTPLQPGGTTMTLRSHSSVLASSRLSREVKNLYIDMIGWEFVQDDIAVCLQAISLVD